MSVRTADNSMDSNYYDVTSWGVGNPHEDIGAVINSIIADIKDRQKNRDVRDGGKPGAVIYLPPGLSFAQPGGYRHQLPENHWLRAWIHFFQHSFQYARKRTGRLS